MVLAIIPARGGSKRLPRKNVRVVGGLPLIAHSVLHAARAGTVDEVVVSTDDAEIAAIAARFGAGVVKRPAELANDTATSESALLHVLETRRAQGLPDPELIVFLQCTSPVRRPEDIDGAVRHLRSSGADSLLSVRRNARFLWRQQGAGAAPINYDYRQRRREQDLDPQYEENGSIYICSPRQLRETGNRLGGRIALYEMDYWSALQIDDPEDLELCGWLLSRPEYQIRPDWAARLELLIFDFDGVLTDNGVSIDQHGVESVRCDRSDGWGVGRLREAGIPMMVVSTEANPVVEARCRKLRLPCYQSIPDKAVFVREYLRDHGLEPEAVAFVGNDENDLGAMAEVGLPIAVGDAHPVAKAAARYVLSRAGGRGAVRELSDLILNRNVLTEA